jgi:hypothetical protein
LGHFLKHPFCQPDTQGLATTPGNLRVNGYDISMFLYV